MRKKVLLMDTRKANYDWDNPYTLEEALEKVKNLMESKEGLYLITVERVDAVDDLPKPNYDEED